VGDQDFFLSLKVVRSDLYDVNTWLKGMSRQAFGDTSLLNNTTISRDFMDKEFFWGGL